MHVGRTKIPEVCPELVIDGWKINEVKDVETNLTQLEDEYEGLCTMETVEEEKYLGDIISSDGKNSKNITARANRGIGTINQIMSILEDVCFGKYYFKVAMVLRNSLLLSSLLTNGEAWYHLTDNDITQLERVDEDLLRRVLECPLSTPKEMLYLELGVTPIRNILRSRRLNFLQYILQEEKDSLMFTFLMAQLEQPTRNDWGQNILKDIETVQLEMSLDEIEQMSTFQFHSLVKEKEKINTLEYLNSIKQKHSKVKHIPHTELEIQDYLKPNQLATRECKFLFAARCRMIDIRGNFSNHYEDTLCPVCGEQEDTQQHLLLCDLLCESDALVPTLPEYDTLFGNNLDDKVMVSRILMSHYEKRKHLLK